MPHADDLKVYRSECKVNERFSVYLIDVDLMSKLLDSAIVVSRFSHRIKTAKSHALGLYGYGQEVYEYSRTRKQDEDHFIFN